MYQNYKEDVLVSWGCYYKILQNGWLINNRNLLLFTILESGKSKIKGQAYSVYGENLISGSEGKEFACWRKMKDDIE